MPVSDLEETLLRIESGQAAEVLPTLEYLAGLFPTSVTAHVLLARACEAEQAWERALAEWQWAATLMPNGPTAHEGIERCVRALSGSGKPAEPEATLGRTEQPGARSISTPPASKSVIALTGARQGEEPDEKIEHLDRLIAELESARITPDHDLINAPPPDLEDEIDDMVSETLARIYAAQKQYDEAARVYELLAAQYPGRAGEFMKKATDMRSLAAEE